MCNPILAVGWTPCPTPARGLSGGGGAAKEGSAWEMVEAERSNLTPAIATPRKDTMHTPCAALISLVQACSSTNRAWNPMARHQDY